MSSKFMLWNFYINEEFINVRLISLPFYSVPPVDTVMNLSINEIGSRIAGENLTITCTIMKTVNGLLKTPTVIWTGPGLPENNYLIKGQNTSSAVLTFNKIVTSQARNYTCQGMLTSPALSQPYVVVTNHSLAINSKCSNRFIGLLL